MCGRNASSVSYPTATACVIALLLAACSSADEPAKAPPPPPEAGYVVLKAESVPLVIELAGRTSAYETSEVRPQVSGIVRERLFNEGSIVQAGQTLYRIDPSLYRAAQAQARANLASARATRESAQALANRLKPLAELEAVSQQEYTNAVSSARAADAAVAQNRAALDAATISLRYTDVAAPIAGRIGRSMVTTGALVTASQTEALTVIQRLDPMFVDIQQSSADLLALRRTLASGAAVPSSAEVRLTLEDGSDYPAVGTLQFAEAMVDAGTGSVTLRARFPNPNGLLLPGMYVRARLSQATASGAILVPQQGVARDPRGQATVMLVGADDKALQQIVQADRTVGDKWLVADGLKAGDKVIVEGLGRIKPGQTIKPVPAGSPPAPAPSAPAGR